MDQLPPKISVREGPVKGPVKRSSGPSIFLVICFTILIGGFLRRCVFSGSEKPENYSDEVPQEARPGPGHEDY